MAAPRVFLSSTYYDLKQLRNDVGGFIKSLGFQVAMHEHSDIAYSHEQKLEQDCYSEVSLCDMVVCIIGNSFGTQSSANELSITMNELNKAFRDRKIVFLYVAKDVWIENRTYQKNRTNVFVPAAVDDIKIHEYIDQLNQSIGASQPIQQFETADDIIASLRSQLAGLFQNLLARRSLASEVSSAMNLHEEISSLKSVVKDCQDIQSLFWNGMASTALVLNPLAAHIGAAFGLSKSNVLLKDIWAVDELAEAVGCEVLTPEGELMTAEDGKQRPISARLYKAEAGNQTITVTVDAACLKEDGSLRLLNRAKSEELVKFSSESKVEQDDMPF